MFRVFLISSLVATTGVTSQTCVDLADPTQNKDVPFKLWDEARGVGLMYSGGTGYASF